MLLLSPRYIHVWFGIFTPAIFSKVSVIMKRRGKPNKFHQAKSQSSNYSKYDGKRVIDFNWCPRGEGQSLWNKGSLWWQWTECSCESLQMAAHAQNRSNRKGLASWNRWKSFAGRGSTEREQWHTLTRNVAWEIALSSKVWSVRHIFVREMYLSLKRNIAMPVVLGTQGSGAAMICPLLHWIIEWLN